VPYFIVGCLSTHSRWIRLPLLHTHYTPFGNYPRWCFLLSGTKNTVAELRGKSIFRFDLAQIKSRNNVVHCNMLKQTSVLIKLAKNSHWTFYGNLSGWKGSRVIFNSNNLFLSLESLKVMDNILAATLTQNW